MQQTKSGNSKIWEESARTEQNWKNENVGLGPVDRAPLAAELHYSYAAMGAVAA